MESWFVVQMIKCEYSSKFIYLIDHMYKETTYQIKFQDLTVWISAMARVRYCLKSDLPGIFFILPVVLFNYRILKLATYCMLMTSYFSLKALRLTVVSQ